MCPLIEVSRGGPTVYPPMFSPGHTIDPGLQTKFSLLVLSVDLIDEKVVQDGFETVSSRLPGKRFNH